MSKKAIGIASLIYGITILASRLIGLIRESVIGRILGAGSEADVYWAAFIIPDFLNYLLAGGILSIAFIPLFQKRLLVSQASANTLFSTLFSGLVIASTLLTLVLWVFVPSLTPLIAPGLNAADLETLNGLVRIILPAQIFHLSGALLSAALQAQDKHLLPAIAPVVYTACIVLGGIALGAKLGAEGFAWGVLVGSFLGPLLCPIIGALKTDIRWSPRHSFKDPDVRKYVLLSLPIMLGFSIVVLDDMIVKAYASMLPGAGAISELQYARTLMKVPMGVFGMAAGMAAFPTLSRLFAAKQRNNAYDTLAQAVRMTLLLACLAQAALSCVGTEIATVIWGDTRFSPSVLNRIGALTAIYALGLWAWSIQGLLARGYYAQGNTWAPTIIGTVLMAAWLPVYELCAGSAFELALASSGAISVYVLCLANRLFAKDDRSRSERPALWQPMPVLILAVLITTLFVNLIKPILNLTWPPLVSGGLYGILALFLCAAISHLLGNQEIRVLTEMIGQRIRRTPRR